MHTHDPPSTHSQSTNRARLGYRATARIRCSVGWDLILRCSVGWDLTLRCSVGTSLSGVRLDVTSLSELGGTSLSGLGETSLSGLAGDLTRRCSVGRATFGPTAPRMPSGTSIDRRTVRSRNDTAGTLLSSGSYRTGQSPSTGDLSCPTQYRGLSCPTQHR